MTFRKAMLTARNQFITAHDRSRLYVSVVARKPGHAASAASVEDPQDPNRQREYPFVWNKACPRSIRIDTTA